MKKAPTTLYPRVCMKYWIRAAQGAVAIHKARLPRGSASNRNEIKNHSKCQGTVARKKASTFLPDLP